MYYPRSNSLQKVGSLYSSTSPISFATMIHSAEEFVRLRSGEDKDEYDRAAMEEAPLSVWRAVISSYPAYRKWVAHNKTIPLEILEELCTCDSDVRVFVAMKRSLSAGLFQRLANDEDSVVRQQIAANKKAPREIVERLSHDADEDVARVARFNLKR